MQWLFGNDALTQSIVSCCARLKTSTLFEDKVFALNELEKLSKEHPLQVGIKSIGTICDDVLSQSQHESDPILTSKCIDILVLLLLPPEQPYDESTLPRHPQTQRVYYECNLDLLFTPHNASGDRCDIFIKLLREEVSEFIEMQYNIIQILTVILLYKNTRHKLRTQLINIYGAMNTLSQLLNSQHEFIRNSCLILLAHLSADDASIQKLIAFDGAFERVLAITKKEDGIHGGMVVRDCLYLMDNLLRNNESNQKYFVEIGCVSQLKEVLSVREFASLKEEQVTILDQMINILMQITRNCGHLNNAQKALGATIEALLAVIAFYGFESDAREHKMDNENTAEGNGSGSAVAYKYNILKQKCLVLLRIILYLNAANAQLNGWMTSDDRLKLRYLKGNSWQQTGVNPLLFITKLSLNGYHLFQSQSLNCDPVLSLLSQGVLQSILTQNRALQQVLMDAFIECATGTNHRNNTNQWDIAFGDLLLNMLSMRSIKDGFGDPLRFWMMTRVFTFLFSDNNEIKMSVLSKKLTLHNCEAHNESYFMDILMHSLMQITENAQNETYDERIQIALLLLIICICFECRDAIYTLFGADIDNKRNMQYMISLATCAEGTVYTRGLSTYLIAICMEFARDLTPNMNINAARSKGKSSPFSHYLFWIVHDEIGLERFKLNLEKLRSCREYVEMVGAMEACKEKVNASGAGAHTDEEQRKKRLLIEEIFSNEFNIENDEYLVYRRNRMRVQLFDSRFIHQFEAIYARIDKRIIQLISSKPAAKTIKKQEAAPIAMKRAQINSNHSAHLQKQLNELKTKNEDLCAENKSLKKEICDFKKNETDILNSKMNEINALKRELQMKSGNNENNNTDDTTQKYNTLRQTYEALNRDHEDLLVFVGHLHDKYEEIQKEFNKFKQIKK